MGGYIPEDIHVQILSRLPAKSLVRFQCVCKSWCDTIKSDEFRALQQRNSNYHSKSHRYFAHLDDKYPDGDFFARFSFFDESLTIMREPQHFDLPKAEALLRNLKFYQSDIIGSCNGLICLYLGRTYDDFSQKHYICIWNPAIGRCVIEKFPTSKAKYWRIMLGFGFATRSNEHKLVHIWKRYSKGFQVYVYSLRTRSWTKIRPKPHAYDSSIYGSSQRKNCYFKGSLQWICEINAEDMIVCFGLDDEDFSYIDLPIKLSTWEESCHTRTNTLIVYKDMLSVCANKKILDGNYNSSISYLDIWVMKECGNSNSWIRLVSLNISELNWDIYRVLGADADGRLVVSADISGSKLQTFDPLAETIIETTNQNVKELVPCEESLFLLSEN